jgi:hypothetical protein
MRSFIDVFLKKAGFVVVGAANHGHRTRLEMREHGVGDSYIVLCQLKFGDAGIGPDQALGAGESDAGQFGGSARFCHGIAGRAKS